MTAAQKSGNNIFYLLPFSEDDLFNIIYKSICCDFDVFRIHIRSPSAYIFFICVVLQIGTHILYHIYRDIATFFELFDGKIESYA